MFSYPQANHNLAGESDRGSNKDERMHQQIVLPAKSEQKSQTSKQATFGA